jgi:hypothetical protein
MRNLSEIDAVARQHNVEHFLQMMSLDNILIAPHLPEDSVNLAGFFTGQGLI